MIEFKLPEVGENIESGTVVGISVSVGDTVSKDQDLLELETDKASLPVPSPVSGVIKEILIKEGQEVKIGQVIMKIDGAASAESAPAETSDAPKAETPPASKPTAPAAPKPTAVTPPAMDDSKDTQIVVVGGGPGGYAAAFLSADLGFKTTIVDLEKNPGGVCLYRGCIPSKALLHVAKVISESREAEEIGLTFSKPKVDLDKVRTWKESVVSRLTGGLGQLSKQRKVNLIQGKAAFKDANTLTIEKTGGGTETLTFNYAIIATGSHPVRLPFAPESEKIMDSTAALDLKDIPKKLLTVGGGYIGMELSTVYRELGSEVSIVEMLPNLLMGADRDLARVLETRAKKIFTDIMVETKVTKMEETKNGIKVTFEAKDGKTHTDEFDKVLVSIGRRPNSKGLGLENTNVQVNDRGFIEINDQRQTSQANIYAIGDVAGDPMLAHKASHEGRVAVEAIAGEKVAFEPQAIPAVVFTDPEIAWAGLTETEAKEKGIPVEVVKFPWGASGRAIALNRVDGVTKLIIDPKTERILGMGIAGVGAGELISEGVLAIEMGAVAADIKLSIHPHPTTSETIMETAESFFGQSTHIYRPKKK